jgi:Fur family ferric uptake transcriptional regulator
MNARQVEGSENSPVQRSTRQRRAVESVLETSTVFQTAQDIHDAVRRDGGKAGMATIYRALQVMAESGELDVIKTDGGEAGYRRCSPKHHHHLVCRTCGRTVEVAGPAVERWASKIANEHSFEDVSHTVELFGTCPDCQALPGR